MNRDEAYEAELILKTLRLEPQIADQVNRVLEIFQPVFDNEREKEKRAKFRLSESYRQQDPIALVQKCIQALHNIVHLYESAQKDIAQCERLTQDHLHALELLSLSDEEINEIAKELQEIRKERRKAKDYIQIAQDLYAFATNNRNLAKQLTGIAGEMTSCRAQLAQRKYVPREKTAMQVAFEQAAAARREE